MSGPMEFPQKVMESEIEKALQELETAKSVYNDTLTGFNQLKAAYEAEYIQKNPNASLPDIDRYLEKVLKCIIKLIAILINPCS